MIAGKIYYGKNGAEIIGSLFPDIKINFIDSSVIEESTYVVINEYDKNIGFGLIMKHNNGQYILTDVYVEENSRRKKYGDFIVRILIDHIFHKNVNIIIATVTEESIPFFSSIGFKVIKNENNIDLTATQTLMEIEPGFVCTECSKHD